MIGEKDVVNLAAARSGRVRSEASGAHPLHQAARRLAEAGRLGSGFRTKDLVNLLLSHGARTWRNSLPVAEVRLRVFAPSGKPAVKIRLD